MDIIAGLGAATEGLKLIGELRKIDKEVDKAELKLRLVELADKLLDAKQALQDAQDERRCLLEKITQLEDDLKLKIKLQDEQGLLFEIEGQGVRVGEPYCNSCYVKESKLFRLLSTSSMQGPYKCSNCKGYFGQKAESRETDSIARVRRADWDDFI
jgi:hypothetical protein